MAFSFFTVINEIVTELPVFKQGNKNEKKKTSTALKKPVEQVT